MVQIFILALTQVSLFLLFIFYMLLIYLEDRRHDNDKHERKIKLKKRLKEKYCRCSK